MNKKDTEFLGNIDFWSRHQELDKFNISNDTTIYLGRMSLFIAVLFGIIGLINILPLIIKLPLYLQIIISLLVLVVIIIAIVYINNKRKSWLSSIERSNKHFIAREEMIRYWYNNLKENKVITDKLDKQCKKIREILPKYTGKELRKKVKEIMENP